MREKLLALAEKHPIRFVLIPMVLYFLLMTPAQLMKNSITNFWIMAAVEAIPALGAAWLIHTMGWWRETGFLGPIRWRSLWALLLPAVFIVLNYHGIGMSLSNLMAGAVLTILIGFEEEAFSRGLYLHALTRRYGVIGGAALTSVLFGLGHLHQLLSGAPVLGVLSQVVMAAALGWTFVAIRLRTNSIWPLIIVHALTDLSAFIGGSVLVEDQSGAQLLVNLIVALVLFGYGCLVMRGVTGKGGAAKAAGALPAALNASGRA